MMRSLILVFVALTLSGCATPSYVEPLARFAQAAQQSEQALITLNDDLADDYREEIRAAILERREFRPSTFLSAGDVLAIGDSSWEVLETPGHSPGSICFYDAANGFIIGGDVLFAGSVGRTDLWQGSWDILLQSIREKVLALPDERAVYPGHGPATTVGRERASNPFLQD